MGLCKCTVRQGKQEDRKYKIKIRDNGVVN